MALSVLLEWQIAGRLCQNASGAKPKLTFLYPAKKKYESNEGFMIAHNLTIKQVTGGKSGTMHYVLIEM